MLRRIMLNATQEQGRLSLQDMEAILDVTRALAAPFELHALLEAIAAAARRVLRAERASVWLLDPAADELYVEVAADLPALRIPVGAGLAGACASERRLVNVPDCYADARFSPEVDRRSGYRTRCSLSLPLIDHRGALVGVMQLLNKHNGVFDAYDERLAQALAAQSAMALTRVRMTAELLAGELMRQELELASMMQRSTLPAVLPALAGYALHGHFMPASQTGGDTYDLALLERGLLVLLADATGHGVAPALSVMRMQAMLRMALRLGADLETAFREVNDQLAEQLPDGHFVTTFLGLLDPALHQLRFLSGGQAPILHFIASDAACTVHKATSFPMGAMPIARLRPPVVLDMAPGDWLVLLSDGVYEYANTAGELFGRERVAALVRDHCSLSPEALAERLMAALMAHAQGAPQEDDITVVLLKRESGNSQQGVHGIVKID